MVRITKLAVFTASILFQLSAAQDNTELVERNLKEREPLVQPNATNPVVPPPASGNETTPVVPPAPGNETSPTCDPDVPYLILKNIKDGPEICSGYLNLSQPVTTTTVYETTYVSTEVFTAATPVTTELVVATTTTGVVVTSTASSNPPPQFITVAPVKRQQAVVTPAHVRAIGEPRILSACSCVVSEKDPLTVTTTVTSSLTTSATTTPATVTEKVTSTLVATSTSVTVVTPIPSACVPGYQAFKNRNFDEYSNTFPPWAGLNIRLYYDAVEGTTRPNAVKFPGIGGQRETSLSQQVSLCKGTAYSINFRYSVESAFEASSGNECRFLIFLDNVLVRTQPFRTAVLNRADQGWRSLSVFATAQADSQAFKLQVACYVLSNNARAPDSFVVNVDDFSMMTMGTTIST